MIFQDVVVSPLLDLVKQVVLLKPLLVLQGVDESPLEKMHFSLLLFLRGFSKWKELRFEPGNV